MKTSKKEKTSNIASETGTEVEISKLSGSQILALVIIGILLLLVVYNSIKIINLSSSGISGAVSKEQTISISESAKKVVPKGIPKIYGKELSISYDDISASNPRKADATITVLGNFDDAITLTGADMDRYIKIGLQISCEYCCGAEAIIFKNGKSACGCAHSYAMRGLAKYLIKNHGEEYTDDQILEEMGKWKVLFFPDIHIQKAAVLESQEIELNYINLASNKYRGIEKGQASGGMVGGC